MKFYIGYLIAISLLLIHCTDRSESYCVSFPEVHFPLDTIVYAQVFGSEDINGEMYLRLLIEADINNVDTNRFAFPIAFAVRDSLEIIFYDTLNFEVTISEKKTDVIRKLNEEIYYQVVFRDGLIIQVTEIQLEQEPKKSSESQEETKDCTVRKDLDISDSIHNIIHSQFPGFRIAILDDFVRYWCYFYNDPQVPYYTTGDFNGDGIQDQSMIITTEDKGKSLLVLLDQREPYVLDTFAFISGVTSHATLNYKFDYGLFSNTAGELYDFLSDSTFMINTDNISVRFFEKAANTYYWTGQNYERIHSAD